MTSIDLRAWLRDGAPPELAVGTHEDDVRRFLGDPVDSGGTARRHRRPTVWRWGDVEVGFGEQRLIYVAVDLAGAAAGAVPTGADDVQLDAWCLRARMPRAELEQQLAAAGIAHRVETHWGEDDSRIVCASGATLIFAEGAELDSIYFASSLPA